VFTPPVVPPVPPAPVPAAPATPLGVSPQLFARAKAALDQHSRRGAARYRDNLGIVDFNMASREARFHIVDLASGRTESHLVAHGRGSDRGHSGWLEQFSNDFGSLATSNGAYATAEYYHGKYGLSMKLHGLDWSNNNALDRAIVVHQAWYAEPDMIDVHGKLGRSEGCFAFSAKSHYEVMQRLGGGRMIYADKIA
jgi:L,D-transpeptidase catalytic domain